MSVLEVKLESSRSWTYFGSSLVGAMLSPSTSAPTPTLTPAIPLTSIARASCPPPLPILVAATSAPTPAVIASAPTPAIVTPTPIAPFTTLTPLVHVLIQLIHFTIQRTLPRIKHFQILQIRPRRQFPETRRAHSVFGEEVVDVLIHVCECKCVFKAALDLAVVCEKWF
jgi:hypothetical protein